MAYMEFMRSARGKIVDDLLILKAKGTVATSMVGEDPVGTDKYYDTGGGRTRGDVVYNIYAAPTMVAGSKITLRLQGGKQAAFSTINDLQIVEIGDSTQISGGSDLTTGRYILPWSNDLDGTVYRYVRHYSTMACIDEFHLTRKGIQYEGYLSNISG
jgi:hypothetical protein